MTIDKVQLSSAKTLISHLASFISECSEVDDFYQAIDIFNRKFHTHLIVSNGMTRIAIISPRHYVIKINYGEHGFEFGDNESESFLYDMALQDGYEYLFAQTVLYKYQNRDYYIMPYVYNVSSATWDISGYLSEDEFEWVDTHVWDLHEDNFGFDEYGNVVIVDYACLKDICLRQAPLAPYLFWM